MISYLQIENLTKSFGDRILFENISLGIGEGDRIGLIAKNGAGKTTLLNILAGKENYDSGNIVFRNNLRVGYLEQSPSYPPELTVIQACFQSDNDTVRLIAEYEQALQTDDPIGLQELLDRMDHYKAWDYKQRAKQILSQLKIRNFDQKVKQLSGGQLKRVALANALITEPDLLILDEPTNHLDMETREALTVALSSYEGAVLLVSHDRHLLRASCDELWLVRDGKLSEFDGDLDEYAEIVLKDKKARNAAPEDSGAPAPVNRKEQRRNEAQERARISALSKPLKKELSKIEKELDLANKEKSALDLKLADTDFYQGNQDEVAEALKRHGELSSKIDELEGRWLEISEELQNISSSSDLS